MMTKSLFESVLDDYAEIKGYNAKEDFLQIAHYGLCQNFKQFVVKVKELLPEGCDIEIGNGGMAISVLYKDYDVGQAYRSVNDKEVHCFKIEKPVIRFGMKNGRPNIEGAAKRFIDYLQPNIAEAEVKAQKREAHEAAMKANVDRLIQRVHPDSKDLQRAVDAWGKLKGLKDLRRFYDLWRQQNDKITDVKKADRRVAAFYKLLLRQEPNIPDSYKPAFDRVKTMFEDAMKHVNLQEARVSRDEYSGKDTRCDELWETIKSKECFGSLEGVSIDDYERYASCSLGGDDFEANVYLKNGKYRLSLECYDGNDDDSAYWMGDTAEEFKNDWEELLALVDDR